MEKFKEGTLVCLKTGGPLMTVENLANIDDLVNCVWMINGVVHRDSFHMSHLNRLQIIED